jgi:hypothetical protein
MRPEPGDTPARFAPRLGEAAGQALAFWPRTGDAQGIVTRRGHLIAAAVGLLAVACDRPPKYAVQSCSADVHVLPAKTDILFVVDDSGSMAEEQDALRQNLSSFVESLASSPVPHDFQIGVTTTDVRDFDGTTTTLPRNVVPYSNLTYPIPYAAGTLVSVDRGALTDATLKGLFVYSPASGFGGARLLETGSPDLVSDFEANVLVGINGSGKEQPFHAMELALGADLLAGPNAGFLRHGSRLGVVILTDEDDCSEAGTPFAGDTNDHCHDATIKAQRLMPVADVVSFLRGPIAGEERDPVLAVIAGYDKASLAPTGCPTSYDNPTRLDAAVAALGAGHTLRASICDASNPGFGPALEKLADLLVPQTVPLSDAPADPRLLVVSLQRGGSTVSCQVAAADDAGVTGADAVFTPPLQGEPATLRFQNRCVLHQGDQLQLRIICAG